MTQEKKTEYEAMDRIPLVEALLAQQSEVLKLHDLRDLNKNDLEKWQYYEEAYFQACMDLIDLKYMVIEKMK